MTPIEIANELRRVAPHAQHFIAGPSPACDERESISALLDAAASAIEAMCPIPISERLPENGAAVLWWIDNDWETGTYKKDRNEYAPDYDGYGCQEINFQVTHWIPLPPGP